MYCTACGSFIKDEHRFCTHCGAPRPVAEPGPKGSRAVPVFITFLMFLIGLGVYVFSQFS